MKLSGWGRFPVLECHTTHCHNVVQLSALLRRNGTLIPRGNGRAYGDAALNPQLTLFMRGLDRLRSFDADTGFLTCEAGVLLADILEIFVPRGWFPAVVPGTKFVTVGGMVAADVHGKNHHHSSTFGRHVESVELAIADGTIRQCSRVENPDLFHATVGGMGLTGVILSVTFRLIPIDTAYIREETLVAANLEEAMTIFNESNDWPYSVAWIDCLAKGRRQGRALVSRGKHIKRSDLLAKLRDEPLGAHRRGGHRIPFDAPSALLNGATIKLFNAAYYARGISVAGERAVHYDRFFFPLDRILEWNRLYGRRGFAQYQCVIPKNQCIQGLTALLECIATAGAGSFLAVLKLMGKQGEGLLSFPIEGYTLALDFPIKRGTFDLLAELDRITIQHGGRIYLAKDSCTSSDLLRAGYGRLGEFEAMRAKIDAGAKFASAMSRRLDL